MEIIVMLNHFNTKVRVANPKNHKEAKLFQLESKFISIEATIKLTVFHLNQVFLKNK
jgi:hypothetical protein